MTDPFQVLAFDPGGSTGWASAIWDGTDNHFTGGTFSEPNHHKSIRGVILVMHDACQKIATQSDHFPKLHVVTESFDFRQAPDSAKQRTGLELISRNYIGVMELVTQDLKLQLSYQKPATRKWINDKKLAQLGLLTEPIHENRHMHDAYRHLIHYIVQTLKHTEGITEHWKVGDLHE